MTWSCGYPEHQISEKFEELFVFFLNGFGLLLCISFLSSWSSLIILYFFLEFKTKQVLKYFRN